MVVTMPKRVTTALEKDPKAFCAYNFIHIINNNSIIHAEERDHRLGEGPEGVLRGRVRARACVRVWAVEKGTKAFCAGACARARARAWAVEKDTKQF